MDERQDPSETVDDVQEDAPVPDGTSGGPRGSGAGEGAGEGVPDVEVPGGADEGA